MLAKRTNDDHVFLRGKSWYFRLPVPDRLHGVIGRKADIVLAIKDQDPNDASKTIKPTTRREAIKQSEPLLNYHRALFSWADYAVRHRLTFINADELTEAAILRVDQALKELRGILIVQAHGVKDAIIDARHALEYLSSGKADFSANFKSFVGKCGVFITEKSPIWESRYPVSVEMFKASIDEYVTIHRSKAVRKISAMSVDEYIDHTTSPPPKPATVNHLLKPTDASDSIQRCFERVVEGNPNIRDNPKELGRWQNVVDAFVDYLGENKPANYVDYDAANKFIIKCENYPKTRNNPLYKGKSFSEKVDFVLENRANDVEVITITAKTIEDWRAKLAIIFDTPIKDGKAFTNVFRLIEVRVGRKSIKKKPFTQSELTKILSAVQEEKKRDRFWIIAFLLYHGCRLSEFVNRKFEDLQQEDGIWYIDIREAKTDDSVRWLPIHKKILDLGFIEYIRSQKHKANDYIFKSFATDGRVIEGVFHASKLPSDQFTNWFNAYFLRGKLNISSPEKTLHCLRHNWITTASKKMEEICHYKLAGHTPDQVHNAIYNHRDLAELKEALDNVDYPAIEHLLFN